jgi:hypothetical protein
MLRPQIYVKNKKLFGPLAMEKAGSDDESGVSWCLGWARKQTPMGEVYFHIGSEMGSENFVMFFPGRKEGMVMLSAGPETSGVTRKIVKQMYGEIGLPFDWLAY